MYVVDCSGSRTPSAELDFEEQEPDPNTLDDDATEAFDGIAEEIQKDRINLYQNSKESLPPNIKHPPRNHGLVIHTNGTIYGVFNIRVMGLHANMIKHRSKALEIDTDIASQGCASYSDYTIEEDETFQGLPSLTFCALSFYQAKKLREVKFRGEVKFQLPKKDTSMVRSGNAAWLMWRIVDVLVS